MLTRLFEIPPLWFAAVFAAVFALVAWKMRWLTRGGAVATFVVGFVIYGFGGGKALVPLLTFFLTSTLLSRLGKARKAQASTGDEKGSTRDAGQVFANGGMAVLLVLAFEVLQWRWPVHKLSYFPILFLAALATVNADTWATEIGKLWRGRPRLLSSWKSVAPGTSGAVTLLGLVAALAGAVVVPLSVAWLWPLNRVEFVAVAWAGFLGCILDSILGASVQALYRDTVTGETTERSTQGGRHFARVRGLRWINNDMVNFLASLGGVLCAWALLWYTRYPFH
jgi:uncharacterized protein (TIGR00297 family)